MSKTVASADITVLDFSVLLDISTAIPTAKVTNLSTVVNANNLQWIFEFYSPSLTPIHVGNFTTPDINHVAFTIYNFAEQIPQVFKQIEYSQTNQYTVKVSVKDNAGNVFYLTKGASLCKPNGNTGKNNFGAADISIETKCQQGQLYITDKTNLIYKSIDGTKVSTTATLTYPKDEAGNTLSPVTVNSIPALLPIKNTGDGHEVYVYHIFDYDLGDNFIVRVRYTFTQVFAVWCDITLQPLFCEIDKVVDFLEKNCFDTQDTRDAHKKLNVVNAKMLKAHTGIVQPLTGIDVPLVVEEIKEILMVDCDCCRPAGISNVGSIQTTDAVFTVNKSCGDMLLSWTNDGAGNITLNYQNYSYTFLISAQSGNSAALSYQSATVGCNKQTALFVDLNILSTEILTSIQNSPTLLNILNSITQKSQLICTGLNGGAAFNFGACDYSVELDASVAGALFQSILINGVTYTAPGATLLTNAAAIQSYLNSLSKGSFTVNYSAFTTKTTIVSVANTNSISTAATAVGAVVTTTAFSNNCGLICNILQKILDYLNGLSLIQSTVGGALTICSLDNTGAIKTQVFTGTETAFNFAITLSAAVCSTVNYMQDKLVSCDNVKKIFASFTDAVGNPNSADVVLMYKNGKCQQMPFKNFALSIFGLLITDVDVKNVYCQVSPCSSVAGCSPVTSLTSSGGDTSHTYNWATVAGAIGYKWSIDGTTWITVTSTAAFITGLTANTAYLFRVYPIYTSGDGSACMVTNNFTTTNTGATCAAPGSLVSSNVAPDSFTETWAAVTGASGYEYRINGGGWIGLGIVLTVTPSGLTASTLYNFEVRALIGGEACSMSSTNSVTTLAAYNYTLSPSYNFSITSVTGTNVPSLPPTGITGNSYGVHGAMSGSYSVVLSGTIIITTKLVAIKNGTQVACIAVTASGTYSLSITALSTDIIIIAVDSGIC